MSLPSGAETPNYNAYLDAWGNYQYQGENRFENMLPGLTQTPSANFDPAAWQLKWIQLPSGGEIHIQYESDDYLYVQDKRAMKLVSLLPNSIDDNHKYYLNLADLGSNANTLAQYQVIANELQGIMAQGAPDNAVYFKFLYALLGNNPDLNKCNSDYLKGYAELGQVSYDGSGVFITFDAMAGGLKSPKKACQDWFRTEKAGNIVENGNCVLSAGQSPPFPNDPELIDGKAVIETTWWFLQNLWPQFKPILDGMANQTCQSMNYAKSYIRVPVLASTPKLGGGLRVKRLLMYDKGIEADEAAAGGVLYGSEYSYVDGEGHSTGVSTYEPQDNREENPHVTYLHRNPQNAISRIICGRDRKEMEGPLGEMIMPSASVGYSKVTIKNIHSGKTVPPYTIKEFHTAKEFPFKVNPTELEKNSCVTFPLPLIIVNIVRDNCITAQGYNMEFNNMHGQIKNIQTLAGNGNVISSEQYTYFQSGESIPVMTSPYTIEHRPLGQETEMAMEAKDIEEVAENVSGEGDVVAGLIMPFMIPSGSISGVISISLSEQRYRTHTTSKITNYPAIVKSVTSTADGITKTVENTAFDPLTGSPLLTTTYDGYHNLTLPGNNAPHKGVYNSYSFPASQNYDAFGQKAKNEGMKFPFAGMTATVSQTNSQYYLDFAATNGGSICEMMESLGGGGDLVQLYSGGSALGYYHLGYKLGNKIEIFESRWGNSSPLTTGQNVSFRVIKSGFNNRLTDMVGSLVTYGLDVQNIISTIDATEWSARQAYVDLLNDMLNNPSIYPPLQSVTGSLSNPTISSVPLFIGTGWNPITTNPVLNPLIYQCHFGPGCFSLNEILGGNCSNYGAMSALYMSLFQNSSQLELNGLSRFCGQLDFCAGFSLNSYPSDVINKSGGNGHFGLNEAGMLVYYTSDNPCDYTILEGCYQFCNPMRPIKKILDASAVDLADYWDYNDALWAANGASIVGWNEYDKGLKGKWRVKNTYKYKTDIISGTDEYNGGSDRIYQDAGVYTDFSMFNWRHPQYNSDKWKALSTVTRYAPHGEAIEEHDILGIYSAAKIGYHHTLPYLAAKNADYESVQFESFENTYNSNTLLEDMLSLGGNAVTTAYKHSGKKSLELGVNQSFSLNPVRYTQQIDDNGLIMKVWVRDGYGTNTPIISVTAGNNTLPPTPALNQIARNGEWTLYEAKIICSNLPIALGQSFMVNLLAKPQATAGIQLDDIRLQPSNAQLTAYVYDTDNLKLLTSFDDQHFGLYYQYDAEGKLVRKMVETEKGMKTVQETQYNTTKVPRGN